MSQPTDAMEIDGVRFTSSEVESVTIRRNGRKIKLGKRKAESRLVGFSCEEVATEGDEQHDEQQRR